MFIVSCILSVTKMSKEELADFVSITKEMLDEYLNGEEIPKKIKERFATIFSFPVFYFDVDTKNDKYFEHIMRETIINEWENNKPKKYQHNITDEEIIDCLINAYDLITHQEFNSEHILNNKSVKEFLIRHFKNNHIKKENRVIAIKKDILNPKIDVVKEKDTYSQLVLWRKKKSIKENMKEFMIISDKVLKNIVDADINEQKDLLKVSGIGLATYGKYGEEIYEIIKKYEKKEVEVLEI